MKKQLSFGITIFALAALLASCGGATHSENTPSSNSTAQVSSSQRSSSKESVSQGPVKKISNVTISLGNDGEKAYITVRGEQSNYTEDDFKWAWGLKDQDSGTFADGKYNPDPEDFKKISFDTSNQFVVKYCLTDITTIKAGTLYRIYGGTPESYGDIGFTSNMFGASDATRKYYLRQDQDNSLTFDSVQPIVYTEASIVNIGEADLPAGVTQTGAYLKVGGANSKNLTVETINAWHEQGNIAGDFQRVIGDGYSLHVHTDTERFWNIENGKVFFYLYCGFIAAEEGWMVHFDLVSGNQNAGLQTQNAINGTESYTIGDATYKIYSDTNKSGEENYWGCLGVYRQA